MKYKDEYLRTKNKKEFIELASKYYIDVEKTTLVRRYYDLRKKLGKQRERPKVGIKKLTTPTVTPFVESPTTQPDERKMIVLDDMKRLKYELTYDFLKRYGFTKPEINWLIENKVI